MRIGSLPTNVKKRVVDSYIQPNYERLHVVRQAAISCRSAVWLTALDAINTARAWADGELALTAGLILPPETEEPAAAAVMEQLAALCKRECVSFLHANVCTLAEAKQIFLTVAAEAKARVSVKETGVDILLAGFSGMAGSSVIAAEKESELLTHFSASFVSGTSRTAAELSGKELVAAAESVGCKTIVPLSEGGVFAGLWKLAERTKSGLSVDLRKIPLRQETVEVCEMYGLNPYRLQSTGAYLLVSDSSERILRDLNAADIPVGIIGRLTEGNDRIIINEDEKRYLELPAADELYQIF